MVDVVVVIVVVAGLAVLVVIGVFAVGLYCNGVYLIINPLCLE